MKTLVEEWYGVVKAYKLAVFKNFFCIIIYYVPALSLHIESTDSMMCTEHVMSTEQLASMVTRVFKDLGFSSTYLMTGLPF